MPYPPTVAVRWPPLHPYTVSLFPRVCFRWVATNRPLPCRSAPDRKGRLGLLRDLIDFRRDLTESKKPLQE